MRISSLLLQVGRRRKNCVWIKFTSGVVVEQFLGATVYATTYVYKKEPVQVEITCPLHNRHLPSLYSHTQPSSPDDQKKKMYVALDRQHSGWRICDQISISYFFFFNLNLLEFSLQKRVHSTGNFKSCQEYLSHLTSETTTYIEAQRFYFFSLFILSLRHTRM